VGPFFSIINAKVRGEGFRRGNSTILTFLDTVVSHEAFTDRFLLRPRCAAATTKAFSVADEVQRWIDTRRF